MQCIFFINYCVLCKCGGEYFGIVNCKVTLFAMSPKEKISLIIIINFIKKLNFCINMSSLVLLSVMLKYSRYKIHIPVEYLIVNNLIQKEIF